MIAALALAAADPCATMRGVAVEDVRVVAATAVPAGSGFAPPDPRAARVHVAFCRVEALIDGEIGVELWLPADWNGRLLTGGVGGQAGTFNYRELSRGVRRGYASASTDTGHKQADRNWLLDGPKRAVNYAERANHLLAVKAKALIRGFYGRPVTRAIFIGCSGGGRQALTEAQRHPNDYDGIIAGAPGVDTPAMSARRLWEMGWHSRAAGWMAQAQWDLAARTATASCDRDDGVADGVVADPARCRFDFARLLCAPGRTADCLSADQLALVRRIHAPLHDEEGRRIDDGLLPGVPVSAAPLPEPFTPGAPYLATVLFGHGVHRDPDWDPRRFRIARDLPAVDRVMNLRADDPDLGRFAAHGGKLILYQGWLDPLVEARTTIRYFEDVRRRMGAARTAGFARLYMAPGVEHCVGGAGADGFGGVGAPGLSEAPGHDLLSALERWLEGAGAPGPITAARREGGRVVRTRLLCPFPARAVYDGRGDADAATSFRCRGAPE